MLLNSMSLRGRPSVSRAGPGGGNWALRLEAPGAWALPALRLSSCRTGSAAARCLQSPIAALKSSIQAAQPAIACAVAARAPGTHPPKAGPAPRAQPPVQGLPPFLAQCTTSSRRSSVRARSYRIEGKIPEGVEFEVKGPEEGPALEWDADSKTLRVPLSAVEGTEGRRTKLVIFTCNKCGGRTARNVNPLAWDKGMVMCQCAHCEVWHVLSAKNKKIFEEIRFKGAASSSYDPAESPSASGASSSSSSSAVAEGQGTGQGLQPETSSAATATGGGSSSGPASPACRSSSGLGQASIGGAVATTGEASLGSGADEEGGSWGQSSSAGGTSMRT